MYRILIIHDVEHALPNGERLQWAYARRSETLVRYAPPDMHIDRVSHQELSARYTMLNQYDLVFALDYMMSRSYKRLMLRYRSKAPLVVSFNKDARSRHRDWLETCTCADFVICNNVHRWKAEGVINHTCCITNGIDLHDWYETVPIQDRPQRVLWCGGTGASKQKGYDEILVPLKSRLEPLGFECDFRPINAITPDVVYPTAKQREWYNSGSYIVCASATEGGGPGFLQEAVACGCVAVSTAVGSVPEWSVSGENAVIAERSVEAFVEAVCYAREHRERLSAAGMETIRQWSYGPPGNRAEYFYALFRALIERPDYVSAFNYQDVQPEHI